MRFFVIRAVFRTLCLAAGIASAWPVSAQTLPARQDAIERQRLRQELRQQIVEQRQRTQNERAAQGVAAPIAAPVAAPIVPPNTYPPTNAYPPSSGYPAAGGYPSPATVDPPPAAAGYRLDGTPRLSAEERQQLRRQLRDARGLDNRQGYLQDPARP